MQADHPIIAIVGMTGSGKSVVADELVRRGYGYHRFGQITLDIVKQRGLPPTEENERGIREALRREHGMGAYAVLSIPRIDELAARGPVVADGLYSWAEYKILKERYGDRLTVMAIYAPPQLRYQRLTQRRLEAHDTNLRNRPATPEQARARDRAEIENLEKGGPIAMADYTLINTGSVPALLRQLEQALAELAQTTAGDSRTEEAT